MSTQVLGTTGEGPIRDRETGHVINVDVPIGSATPVTYIQDLTEIDSWSLQLTEATGNVTATITVSLCNDYIPHPEAPQDETRAIRPGTWVEWTAHYVGHPDATPKLPPTGGAPNSQLITQANDTDIERFAFAKITITPNGASVALGHIDGYVTGKSVA